jgi:hypothetical protein
MCNELGYIQAIRLTWIFHELEALIGKAFKGAAVLRYRKALVPPPMGGSASPEG